MQSLADKVIIVTGSGRGIGAATALQLAQRKAKLLLVARSDAQLSETEARCAEATTVTRLALDLSRAEAPAKVFEKAIQTFGRVDGLINNAAQFTFGEIETVTPESFDADFMLNVKAPYFLCQQAFKTLSRGGAIINISSVAGIRSYSKFAGSSVYAMTKFAIVGMTEVLAVEGRAKGIHVNCIAPGAFETQMLKAFNSKIKTSSKTSDLAHIVCHTLESALFAKLSGATLEVPTDMWVES